MTEEGIKNAAVVLHPVVEHLEEDYETMYQRHLAVAERAKSEYKRHLHEMVDKLSTSHLEPLATALLNCEDRILIGQDEVIRLFKENLVKQLSQALETSWTNHNIANNLAILGVLKERYKEFEGQNLHVKDLIPAQKILPYRIRYKEVTKKYLQKEVALQDVKLKELMEKNLNHRNRIQEITNQRVYLRRVIESVSKQLPEDIEKMQQLEDLLLKD